MGAKQPPAPVIDARGFVEVRNSAGVLVFKYDPTRDLVEIKAGGRVELIDLRPLRLVVNGLQDVQGKAI